MGSPRPRLRRQGPVDRRPTALHGPRRGHRPLLEPRRPARPPPRRPAARHRARRRRPVGRAGGSAMTEAHRHVHAVHAGHVHADENPAVERVSGAPMRGSRRLDLPVEWASPAGFESRLAPAARVRIRCRAGAPRPLRWATEAQFPRPDRVCSSSEADSRPQDRSRFELKRLLRRQIVRLSDRGGFSRRKSRRRRKRRPVWLRKRSPLPARTPLRLREGSAFPGGKRVRRRGRCRGPARVRFRSRERSRSPRWKCRRWSRRPR